MRYAVSPFLFLLVLFTAHIVPAGVCAAVVSSFDEALRVAEEKNLQADRYWNILLHYRETLTGRESLIDDPQFFLSPAGKHDPAAELQETIRAFYDQCDNSTRHPACRFIARYSWISEQLAPGGITLPAVDCQAFKGMMRQVNPKAATLIFPSAYMNNPASLFGHTLINIEGESSSKLLSHAVNYSALTRETNGLVFAVKGICGFYKGYYSVLPYYTKVQEYNDISQRDIWEYRLDLTGQEVHRMVMHLWEMQNIFTYYYFFDENCSYNLLFLLDAARPSLGLTDQFGKWVIPIDTIKAVRQSGIIKAAEYRPSKATKIKHLASLVGPDASKQARGLAGGAADPAAFLQDAADTQQKILSLDLAVEYLQYRYVKRKVKQEQYADLFLKLLAARSSLGKAEYDPNPATPSPPEEGHDANRFSAGMGSRSGHTFYELCWRPAYHDLLDSEAGYSAGSQIQFCGIALRYYPGANTMKLHQFNLIDIISLAGRDIFFKPFSWKASTGLKQIKLKDGNDHLGYFLRTGGGLAYACGRAAILYGMVETEAEVTGALANSCALGAGPSIGIRKNMNAVWTVAAGAKTLFYGPGDNHREYEVWLAQNFSINRKHALRVEVSRALSFDSYTTDVAVRWNIYY